MTRLQMPSLAFAGLMILNAILSFYLFPAGGFHAALCSILALIGLIPHLLAIVWHDYQTGRRHMNELVLIAVAAAAARGDATGFLTGAIIAFFLLIGLMIENRSAAGAQLSLKEIAQMTSGKVRRLNTDGSETEIDPETLTIGMMIRLRPGEVIPADGVIVSGNSTVQEANITGESIPAEKTAGDKIFAGTINLSGAPDIEVTGIGAQTVIGKVADLILDAERTRPSFVRMIDLYAQYYTPLVLMLTFFIWVVFDHDWSRVVTVLVAACPIALVLSTPSAAVAAISVAARMGVLIKNVGDIEILSAIKTYVFDKTGTLTTGSLEVTRLAPVENIDSETLLSAACAAGQNSNHPVSIAICTLGKKVHIPFLPHTGWSEIPGRGISCQIPDGTVLVGNLNWMTENGVLPEAFKGHHDEENEGMSLLYVMKNGKALGWIALRDHIREEAKSTISALSEGLGTEIIMVTGDREPVARQVALEIGIQTWFSHCKPADKIAEIEKLKQTEHEVIFVGDGVNDGPALAASNIGIAMGAAGNNLAIETASIALMNNKLDRLLFLRKLSSAYRQLMIQNFALGIFIISAGITIGVVLPGEMSGQGLGAILSAGLQVVGALAVTMNSARLMRLSH